MIFNLGSINADYFYDLPHLPGPGETLASTRMAFGLGGKGANQSVAASLAGAEVFHIGAVGPNGAWAKKTLKRFGVDVGHIRVSDTPTAHAIVMVDGQGENQIVIFPGANMDQDVRAIDAALSAGRPGDWLMMQNETSYQVEAAKIAHDAGISVVYSAAPFDVSAVEAMLPYTKLLFLNEVEARQLEAESGSSIRSLPVAQVLITKGKLGAEWHDLTDGTSLSIPAYEVDVIDTTGAGDTFAGYAVASLEADLPVEKALRRASAAAALSTTKKGTADAIPDLNTVEAFLAHQDTNGAFVPQS